MLCIVPNRRDFDHSLAILASLAFGYGVISLLAAPRQQRRQQPPQPTIITIIDKNTGDLRVQDRILIHEYRDPTGRILLHLDGDETVVLGCGPDDDFLILRRI